MSEMRFLSRTEVASLISMEEAVGEVERAFAAVGRGSVQMPPKSYLIFPEQNGDLRSMPAYIPETGAAGVKIVTVHPENPRRDLPTVMAVTVLNDPATGLPVALMDATLLTAVRTGAGGAVATKWLANEGAAELGLVGAGVQARHQLEAHLCVMDLQRVVLYDPRREAAERLADQARAWLPGVEAEVVESVAAACDADVVVTTTPAREPVVAAEMVVRPHTHINGIGADAEGKREVDGELLRRLAVVVDNWEQASHSGEINIPVSEGWFTREDVAAELGALIATERTDLRGRASLFDSTGLAIQDMATARVVFQRAKEQGVGTLLNPLA